MAHSVLRLDFGDTISPKEPFTLHHHIIEDRGSKYSVSIGYVENKKDIQKFLSKLKQTKKYDKATHHSWAVRITHDNAIYETKRDDGETGAGMVILRIMQKENVTNCIICVTRWFGGVKLMGDRFKHLQDATSYALDTIK